MIYNNEKHNRGEYFAPMCETIEAVEAVAFLETSLDGNIDDATLEDWGTL